jgi:hypothetical protein
MAFREKQKDTDPQISLRIFAFVLICFSRLHFGIPPHSHNIRIAHHKTAVNALSYQYHIILTFQAVTGTLVPLLNIPLKLLSFYRENIN